jgi:hypothetical protein
MTLYIVACGVYCEEVTGNKLPVLKHLVKESVGAGVRRVDRFIQLALIGAGRASTGLPRQSAVYLTSGRGDMEVTVDVLDTIYRHRQVPKPLNFINTVSNAACFYIAHRLGLQGPSSFVSSRYFALETALKCALVDFQLRRIESALVGLVEVAVDPLPEHRQRLGLAAEMPVAEGSHWLQLVREPGERKALASLELVQQFGDRSALALWLSKLEPMVDGYLAVGQYVDQVEAAQWMSASGMRPLDCPSIGYFDGWAGRAICHFVTNGKGSLLYLNRDRHGRYMVVLLKK